MRQNRPSALTQILQRVVDVKDDELHALLLSCAYFFFILSSYYILRPIRDEVAVFSGARSLPFLFTGTLILMLLAHLPFAALVAALPRTKFISYTYRFFMANLLIFFALLKLAPESWNIWIGRGFFWWVSVFNLFVVSVFWAFTVDLFKSEQGKRLFGFIAMGGTVGAIVGAAITAALAVPIGPAQLILVSVVLLELAVRSVRRLEMLSPVVAGAPPQETGPRIGGLPEEEPGRGYSARRRESKAGEPIGGGVLNGITATLRSPYLLGICAYMLMYTIMATFLYFQQTEIVGREIADRAVRVAFFAKIDLAVNVSTLSIQAFFTGRILKWLGVAVSLTILPAICMIGFTGLGLWPLLGVLVAFQVARRASNFGVARPTREILWTVVGREQKYKAKNFVDTFVYRGGDQIGAWSYALMGVLGLSMSGIAFVAAPLAGVWLIIGYLLGRKQMTMSRDERAAAAVAREPAPVAS